MAKSKTETIWYLKLEWERYENNSLMPLASRLRLECEETSRKFIILCDATKTNLRQDRDKTKTAMRWDRDRGLDSTKTEMRPRRDQGKTETRQSSNMYTFACRCSSCIRYIVPNFKHISMKSYLATYLLNTRGTTTGSAVFSWQGKDIS